MDQKIVEKEEDYKDIWIRNVNIVPMYGLTTKIILSYGNWII